MNARLLTIAAVLMLVGAGCAPATGTTVSTSTGGSVLDLSGQGLRSLPSSTFSRTGLRELDISDNALTGALPGEIRFLSKLEVLDASGNQMTGVPAEIGQLANLRILDLSDNKLTGLPNELGNLKRLETLDLSGNAVSEQDLEVIRKGIPNARIVR
ncbi:hypothetical protein EPO33_00060 [Patescibacteria group bacterium]|nr:MAG: hypothetical protein EPO33_00060 [Patescibacteria group bacterium]